ncbi:hypothetical protein CP533_6915 [Ophiocordyceps camponoti-saundersi (nom. inval.)]|nr:hypothetical protein CP533_6915 [Ophiocordyceps camponoti-saundersi (nom. inval.)]
MSPPQRIDAFEGSQVEYAAYLLSRLTPTPTEVIECLENAVNRSRQLSLSANDQPQFIFCIGREESEVKQNIPKWREATRSFFSHIPCDEDDWATKRQAVCLSSAEDILRAVETLAGHSSCLAVPDSSQNEHFLVNLGIRAGQLISEAKFAEKTSHYLAVVFAATCLVAEELHLAEATLNEAMLAFLVATRRKDPIMSVHSFEDFIFSGSNTASPLYTRFLRDLMPRSTKILLTHGDIRPANIMLRMGDDGIWSVAAIIDWESSGFYPEYWEAVKATNLLTPRERFDWYNKETDSTKRHKDSQLVDLYCAIYMPVFGNYYHWAFAMNHRQTRRWHLFHVIQEEEGGPFTRNERQVDPSSSSSCLQPLNHLGQMRIECWGWLIEAVPAIVVPGVAEPWNCQDYVIEIWELLLEYGVIDEAAWNHGYQAMLPYYGQDFGDQGENDYDEYEDEEDGEDGEDGDDGEGGERILSEALVYDSDDVT